MGDAAVPSADPITSNMIVTLICSVIVMIYAARRYDTPDTNRLTTTRSLFLATGAGYLATSLVLFLLLCEVALKPGVLDFLGVSDTQKVVAAYASPPVLAAVILTTMLPNVAVLRTADDWFLKQFQSWGRIPHGVRNLMEKMSLDSLRLDPAYLTGLREWIMQDGDVPNELADRISLTLESTSSGCLTRVLRLYRELEKLETAQSYARCFRTHAEEWRAIQDDVRVFAAESHAFFVLFDQLKPVEGSAGEDALKQARDRYRDICRRLFRRMTEFLAASLLMVEASDSRIQRRLDTTGFVIADVADPAVPIGGFVFLGVMMMLAIIGVASVVHPHSETMPLAVIALLIGLTKAIGIVVAVFPKFRWAWFRPDRDNRPPYLAWVASAALAMIVAFIIERLAFGIIDHNVVSALDFQRFPVTPLAPTAFTLCLAIAVLCDIDLLVGNRWLRRVAEALLCGATMLATITVCIRLLDIASPTAHDAGAWFPFVFSFAIGFLAGLMSPHLYRSARHDLSANAAGALHPMLDRASADGH